VSYNERFAPGSYFDEIEFGDFLQEVSKIEDVTDHLVNHWYKS